METSPNASHKDLHLVRAAGYRQSAAKGCDSRLPDPLLNSAVESQWLAQRVRSPLGETFVETLSWCCLLA